MRELIRKRRKKQIAGDEVFLKNAVSKAPPGDPSDAEMAEIYARIRKDRNKKR